MDSAVPTSDSTLFVPKVVDDALGRLGRPINIYAVEVSVRNPGEVTLLLRNGFETPFAWTMSIERARMVASEISAALDQSSRDPAE